MEAIAEKNPAVRFEIFTSVPEVFFRESLGGTRFGYHLLVTDVGLVQKSPFAADLEATAAALDRFFPIDAQKTAALVDRLKRLGCGAVLCDIAPLGIVAARKAGLFSVLVENFTWDWIYEAYARRDPKIGSHVPEMAGIFAGADVRIQAEPVCRPMGADLTVEPVSRKIRTDPDRVKKRLGLPRNRPVVLVSSGGVAQPVACVKRLSERPDLFFVIANAGVPGRLEKNVLALGAFEGVYHPDLVGAADALVGKAGYSTVAEACRAGVPFGYGVRGDFRESAVLERFISDRLGGIALEPEMFDTGAWIERVDVLLSAPRHPAGADGADRIAEFLLGRLDFLAPSGPPKRSCLVAGKNQKKRTRFAGPAGSSR